MPQMGHVPGDELAPALFKWEELPAAAQQKWRALAIELPLPPDTSFSGSGARIHEMNPEQWERRINRDPVLAGKVLAVANSAALGQSQRVTTVARAAVLLGYNLLQAILVGYHLEGVVGRWPKYPRAHFDFVRRWSAAASVLGFHLARSVNHPDPYLLGTSSLLARLGSLIIGLDWPAPGPDYMEQPDEAARLALELGRWKVTSAHLSTLVAQHWGLPEPLPLILGSHSLPLVVELPIAEYSREVTLVCCAVALGAAAARGAELEDHLGLAPYAVLQGNAAGNKLAPALAMISTSPLVRKELAALLS